MKKFFLSVSVVAAFVIYSFTRQSVDALGGQSGPVTSGLPVDTPEPTRTPSPAPTAGTATPTGTRASPAVPTATPVKRGQYRDGTYTGSTFDAFYGNIQVQAIIRSGRLADVNVLQYPNDRRTSVMINSQALPMLKQEAIQAQSANVDIISGASDTSSAYVESLRSALQKAL